MSEWECGLCGAFTDMTVAEHGEPFHLPDEDCRAVRPFDATLNHDNHEYYDTDCTKCRAILEPEMEAARRAYAGSKPYDRELQEMADNDRELQRDEFHR